MTAPPPLPRLWRSTIDARWAVFGLGTATLLTEHVHGINNGLETGDGALLEALALLPLVFLRWSPLLRVSAFLVGAYFFLPLLGQSLDFFATAVCLWLVAFLPRWRVRLVGAVGVGVVLAIVHAYLVTNAY
ncbi:MAG TPA: hypothetical protein VM030_04605 [Acidimicrobiales bacterium]|nr:hypothetical protein [Acidimicrobiales bacterium]